ncbi:hypothetical protein B1C78_06675 [Thioalkalivibrio denitrificans]|uniref:Uncharacterized protein n=1 Tax=Thioalkalivibrio denitrificans TaxID=108003 RepID=A0A1V3NK14_9GAMM|nr:hypothetical protein [Thioalkalivibrio denitrificans]OOG25395.1 hypothetical protein B1C78_06675 [Thioalkalivibrio denitrificans]
MLLALQFPFADARPFLNQGPARLSAPAWPIPIPQNEFVRGFGAVRSRARGAPVGGVFSQDFYFAGSKAAIKLPGLGDAPVGPPAAGLRLRGAFRRFFCDGGAVSRVEIGLGLEGAFAVDGDGLLGAIRDVLRLPTAVKQLDGMPQRQPLGRQGAALAKLYAQATSHTTDLTKPMAPANFVWPGFPVVVVEYEIDPASGLAELTSVPARSDLIQPDKVGGLTVAHLTLAMDGRNIGIWLIGHTRQDADAARRLRLCVLRLHAEQQALGQMLRWMAKGTIQYQPHTPTADRLEEYLNQATHTIFQKARNGVEQISLRNIMAAYDWVMSPSERAVLLQQLEQARRQVRLKLERFTQLQGGEPRQMYVEIAGNITGGNLTIMGTGPQQTVNIDYGQGNTFNGDAIAAGYIKDSFNIASGAGDNKLQDALTELTKTVAEMAQKLDADQQRQATRKLKALTEEATDPNPDKSALKFNGKGLIEAAKTVAEMVGPVTTAVKGVLALLGIAL